MHIHRLAKGFSLRSKAQELNSTCISKPFRLQDCRDTGHEKHPVLLTIVICFSILVLPAYLNHYIEEINIISPYQSFEKIDQDNLSVILEDKEKISGLSVFSIIPLLEIILFENIPSRSFQAFSLDAKVLILRC
jgi:hypothetical protein